MIRIHDDLGTEIILDAAAKRVVSLVPSITKSVCDLGAEHQLIGVTKFCVHPAHIRQTTMRIGGTKNANIERITALNPDLILANKEENTLADVAALRNIAPVFVTDVKNRFDSNRMLENFGVLLGKRVEAAKWIAKINQRLSEFQDKSREIENDKVLYLIWKNPWMSVGGDTYIDEMLRLAGFQNVCHHLSRYPEIVMPLLRKDYDPDYVFLSSEPYPFSDTEAFEVGRYTHHAKTVFVDGEMFSWFGTGLHAALDYFDLLHSKIKG